MEYLKILSKIQKECVENTNGPMMIISGPGSGKTRVITTKIAHLLNIGINRYNILALTFTNKSAKEMVSRIDTIIPENKLEKMWAGTFHSVFSKILRIEAEKIGFNNHFTILDNEDSKNIIKRIIQDQKIDKEKYKPNSIFSKISLLKNKLITPKKYADDYEMIKSDEQKKLSKFLFIYKTYTLKCKESDSMDFDDLLLNTLTLFQTNNETLEKYQKIFKYILIDEFQDTNLLQLEIIKNLAKKYNNLCVVGDDSQSIYSFRGANIHNILNFNNLYPTAKIYKLEQNYRSSGFILNAANSLINHNEKKIEKNIWTEKGNGEKVQVFQTKSDKSEGLIISKTIQNIKTKNIQSNYSDHLILYRMNSQSRSIEEGLRKLNINYKIFGLSFYKRKEIKDVLAYLKLIVNNYDEESLLRIINFPSRGIGKTSIEKIRNFSINNTQKIWNVLKNIKEVEININIGTKNKIFEFQQLVERFSLAKDQNAFELTSNLIEEIHLIQNIEQEDTIESLSKAENIKELLNAIKLFSRDTEDDNIRKFLDESVLINENESSNANKNTDYVSLMTVHQSKGLEFPYIYVLGMEENIFPAQQSLFSKKDIEEERRLLYVAITRAKKKVHLSYCQTRFRFSHYIENEPSRFIKEIDAKCIETTNYILDQPYRPKSKFLKSKNLFFTPKKNFIKVVKNKQSEYENTLNLKIGKTIKHNIFGKGKIIELTDSNQKMEVEFQNKNKKTILVRYAKFDIID